MIEGLKLFELMYHCCTDFIISLANLFSLSYYEINAILFCVLYPLLFIGLIVLFIIQNYRLKKLKEAR